MNAWQAKFFRTVFLVAVMFAVIGVVLSSCGFIEPHPDGEPLPPASSAQIDS